MERIDRGVEILSQLEAEIVRLQFLLEDKTDPVEIVDLEKLLHKLKIETLVLRNAAKRLG